MNEHSVIIVVPIYREFTETEAQSFCQLKKVLGHYPIDLLHPKSLSVTSIKEQLANATDTGLDDNYFADRMTYSDLLLTPDFYRMYSDYDYMLIYQLDAWVFRDELQYWVDKNYDYIGAPWVPRDYIYKRYIIYPLVKIYSHFCHNLLYIPHRGINFHVGNGGFSLRKISTMTLIPQH